MLKRILSAIVLEIFIFSLIPAFSTEKKTKSSDTITLKYLIEKEKD